MPVIVKVPMPLRMLSGGKAEVVADASDIAGLVEALEKTHPGMKERLTEGGKIRPFINVFLNGGDIRALRGEATALQDGDVVTILAAIAGG